MVYLLRRYFRHRPCPCLAFYDRAQGIPFPLGELLRVVESLQFGYLNDMLGVKDYSSGKHTSCQRTASCLVATGFDNTLYVVGFEHFIGLIGRIRLIGLIVFRTGSL